MGYPILENNEAALTHKTVDSFVDVVLKIWWFFLYFLLCSGFIHIVWHKVLMQVVPVPPLSYAQVFILFLSSKLILSPVPFTSNITIASTHISTTDSTENIVKTLKEY